MKWSSYSRWGLSGLALVGLHIFLAEISQHFHNGSDLSDQPIAVMVAVELLCGVLYMLVVLKQHKSPGGRGVFWWMLGIGFLLRLIMFLSAPILEDDYYRYLWDGGVTANGFNPYAFSPEDVLDNNVGLEIVPPELRELAFDSGSVAEHINHPDLRTIYPPIAQTAFALAYFIQPWNLFAWRSVLFFFDLAVLGLLVVILRQLKLPLLAIAVYWWNPLLIKEIFNSAHMDILVLPFILGSILLTVRHRYNWAALCLAFATGVKVWPFFLLPLILKPVLRNPRRAIPPLTIFMIVVALMALPVLFSGLDPKSGFLAYGERWEMNDAFFMLLSWGVQLLNQLARFSAGFEQLAVRILVAAIITLWTVRVTLRDGQFDLREIYERALLIVAAIFLLSPTQFPWYCVWIIPLLVVKPRGSLLLLTALLPIYYLRFIFKARGEVEIFDYWIVWLEYIPVWFLLIREWHGKRSMRQPRERVVVN